MLTEKIKKMKNRSIFKKKAQLAIMLFIILLMSCNKNDKAIIEIPPLQNSWNITYENKTINIDITTSHDWIAEVDNETSKWIDISPTQGSGGKHKLKITISENENEAKRIGTISIISENVNKNITITQNGNTPYIDILSSQDKWNINHLSNKISFDFKSYKDWHIDIDKNTSTWINITPKQGLRGENKLEVIISENNNKEKRTGIFSIISGNCSKNITIIQDAKSFNPESESIEDMPIIEWN